MSTLKPSIKDLPVITEINQEDTILVQQGDVTGALIFSDFIIGLNNISFTPIIIDTLTNIRSVSSNYMLYDLRLRTEIVPLSSNLNGIETEILSLTGGYNSSVNQFINLLDKNDNKITNKLMNVDTKVKELSTKYVSTFQVPPIANNISLVSDSSTHYIPVYIKGKRYNVLLQQH